MKPTTEELEDFAKAKPYIRSCLAFIFHLVHATRWTADAAYITADSFLNKLERDIKERQ